jgi:hypothetical protein
MKLVCVDIKDNKANIVKGPGSPAYFSQAMIAWLRAQGHTVDIISTLDEEKLADADVVWCEWISELAFDIARANICKKLILRMRGVDLYAPLDLMEWGNVHTVVFESPFLRQEALARYPWLETVVRTAVRATGIDTQRFAFQSRVAGKNIAVIARCMADKGFQLVYEAARQLESDGYQFFLGIAHANANPRLTPYLLENKPSNVTIAHNVDPAVWLNDIDAHYIMSASNYETLGYSIVEGMALGLKPLIHRMPGAELHWQPEWLWTSLSDLKLRLQEPYESKSYRVFVEQVFSVDVCGPQFEKLLRESNALRLCTLIETALVVGDLTNADTFARKFREESQSDQGLASIRQDVALRLGDRFFTQGDIATARIWALRTLSDGPHHLAFKLLTDCAIAEKQWECANKWIALARASYYNGPMKFEFSEIDSAYYPVDNMRESETIVRTELAKVMPSFKDVPQPKLTHLAVLVPVYNAETYILDCLKSIQQQIIRNVDIVSVYVLDDASTDRTGELAQQYCREQEAACTSNWRWIYRRNEKRVTALPNLVFQLRELSDDTVVAILDGDDRFAQPYALEYIAGKYRYYDIWMTYGNAITSNGIVFRNEGYPIETILNNTYRKYPWVCYHLHTFVNKLFKKIDEAHFKDDDGNWWQITYDVALYTPMLEMAGPRATYISDILYIYNVGNSISEFKIAPIEQATVRNILNTREPYARLDSLK